MRVCSVAVVVCVALTFVWAALSIPVTAVAKKPNKPGGGKTEIRLARILFVDSPRIKWDGQAACTDPILNEVWDYWDYRDPDLTADPNCIGCRIDVSGGGRVFFFTATRFDRWLTLDLTPTEDDPAPFVDETGDGPNIDFLVYPETDNAPPINEEDTFIDNVKGTISLPNMFKKRATRQPLDLTIRRFNSTGGGWEPVGWSLHSVDDLYILDTADKDVRILTTVNPDDPSGESDADLFELWHEGVTVGIYHIPLTWKMRIIPAP